MKRNLNQIQRRATILCALLATEKLTSLAKALAALTDVIAASAIASESLIYLQFEDLFKKKIFSRCFWIFKNISDF